MLRVVISEQSRGGWSTNHAEEAIEAERLARRALELDRNDPRVLAIAGWVLAYEVGNVDEGAALLDSATELDPNLFMGWEFRGWTALINGDRSALEYFESALRLSPLDPRLFSAHSGIGNAHFLAGRYDEALAWAAKALRQYQHLPAIGVLVASQALTGRADDARASYEMYRHRFPGARLSNIRQWMTLRRDDDIQKFIEGFRLAGMPE
jgi:tetratricopeptide (TPR) repeat protein